MSSSKIIMSHPREFTPPNIIDDLDWVRRNEKALLETYGECSLIVYQHQVIGIGATYEVALSDAEANLAGNSSDITPVHRRIFYRHPFSRLRIVQEEETAS